MCWKEKILFKKFNLSPAFAGFWSLLRLPRIVVYVHTREGRFGGQGFSYSFVLEDGSNT